MGSSVPAPTSVWNQLRTKQAQGIEWAKDIGMTQIGTASLGGRTPGGIATMDAVKAASDEYNKIGETASKSGIQQFLHDEGFELSKVDGRLIYEVFLALLDPKLVKMEFQMSAMKTVGDPVMYFIKYQGRFLSMHLQGGDLSAPPPGAGVGQGGRGARGRCSGWKRQPRLGEDLRRREDWRREEILY
jgi:hypothetical protein